MRSVSWSHAILTFPRVVTRLCVRACVRGGGRRRPGLNFQRGSEFIDGVALEEYADEQDDYAQEREIEACIKAVDVDCDGKIGNTKT